MYNKTRIKRKIPTKDEKNNKQRINNSRVTALERTATEATMVRGCGGEAAYMHYTGTETFALKDV